MTLYPGDQAYSQGQLEQLWITEGGNPANALMASAIALAESRGHTGNVSPSNDWGLWQINGGGQAMLDPVANVKRAIAMSNNGSDWHLWTTAYRGGVSGVDDGGGYSPSNPNYLQAGAAFYQFLGGQQPPALVADQTGGGSNSPAPPVVSTSHNLTLSGMLTNPGHLAEGLMRLGEIVAGGLLLGGGLALIVYAVARKPINRAASGGLGMLLPAPVRAVATATTSSRQRSERRSYESRRSAVRDQELSARERSAEARTRAADRRIIHTVTPSHTTEDSPSERTADF